LESGLLRKYLRSLSAITYTFSVNEVTFENVRSGELKTMKMDGVTAKNLGFFPLAVSLTDEVAITIPDIAFFKI